jgi:hypothetical protein
LLITRQAIHDFVIETFTIMYGEVVFLKPKEPIVMGILMGGACGQEPSDMFAPLYWIHAPMDRMCGRSI